MRHEINACTLLESKVDALSRKVDGLQVSPTLEDRSRSFVGKVVMCKVCRVQVYEPKKVN